MYFRLVCISENSCRAIPERNRRTVTARFWMGQYVLMRFGDYIFIMPFTHPALSIMPPLPQLYRLRAYRAPKKCIFIKWRLFETPLKPWSLTKCLVVETDLCLVFSWCTIFFFLCCSKQINYENLSTLAKCLMEIYLVKKEQSKLALGHIFNY